MYYLFFAENKRIKSDDKKDKGKEMAIFILFSIWLSTSAKSKILYRGRKLIVPKIKKSNLSFQLGNFQSFKQQKTIVKKEKKIK